jgi:hypothetical protein
MRSALANAFQNTVKNSGEDSGKGDEESADQESGLVS